jgi:hypothetical protein
MTRPDHRACPPSSPIPIAAHRLTAPPALAPEQYRDLLGYLVEIADPRHRRGRRHTLTRVLAVAVAAVLTGARSLAAIGEWAADAPGQVLAALGVRRDPWTDAFRPPGEATVRRVQPPPPSHPPRQAVAVDGKTLRGSGHHGQQQVHLLAAMDHTTRAVLGQSDVDTKTNEIARFQPLLEGLDLAGRVLTADAMHTQREHADWLVTHKHAAYLLIVKANQPTLHHQLQRLPWRQIPSKTTPATAATVAPRSAACRQPPSRAWTSPTPPRPSASPDASGPCTAAARAP